MIFAKFRKRRQRRAIDGVAEIENHQAVIEGHGPPELSGSARPTAAGARAFFKLVVMLGLVLAAVGIWRWSVKLDATANSEKGGIGAQARIENLLPGLKLSLPKPVEGYAADNDPPEVAHTPATQMHPSLPPISTLAAAVTVDTTTQRLLSSGLQAASKNEEEQTRAQPQQNERRSTDTGPMAETLRPMQLTAARAERLRNRDLLITQGAMIPCIQETRLVSAQAGMLSCYAPHDVRSTSGRVVLIDAGTKFIGYQQGVLAQGQPRIGVVWSRLETPQGVVIHLDSPATGPLGEAGLDGHIDTHFGERFGGAILVSLISDIGSWATSRNTNNGSVRFDSTGDAAESAITTVLDNSINIPPTLYRNQGARLGIYVARDMDFSPVYALRPVAGH